MKKLEQEVQLKLQAYVDGELSAIDIAQVEALLANDAEAQALVTELKNTAAALKGHEAAVTVPETRDFYWSQIRREIERLEKLPASEESGSLLEMWKRFLVPAGGVLAALVLLAMILLNSGNEGADSRMASNSNSGAASVEVATVENAVDEAEVFTFEDQKEGMLVVWLSYDTGN